MDKKNWYQLTATQASSELASDLINGLSSAEANERLAKHGPNELQHKEGPSLLQMVLEQFKDFLVLILIGASIVSIAVGEVTDSIVIIAIVIVNAVLGVVQEARANKALEALKKMAAPNAKVIRDGHQQVIPARDLVVGDVVVLETGDYVPADIRIIEAINLKIEEAALTGESVPVEKNANIVFDGDTALGDQINCGFMSTVITYGRGKGLVVNTGMNTIIGKIAEMIQSYEEEETPLQKKLAEFGKYLGIACLVICGFVFSLGIFRGEPILGMFMTAVSLAVAAIPEGLPAVVTIVLALGMQRMIQRNSIVKKLHAVETLGSTTVICSDKTGTLTQNQMTAVKLYTAGTVYNVSGEGYNPKGEFSAGEQTVDTNQDEALTQLLRIGGLCNDSSLEAAEGDQWKIIGDPTEGALVVAAAKAGLTKEKLNAEWPRLQEIPFDSERKRMTTFHRSPGGQLFAYTKGAPDMLLELCTHIQRANGVEPITPEDVAEVLTNNANMANQALRVLAVAYKPVDEVPAHPTAAEVENNLVFVGLIGMIDPPRVEAIDAVQVCKTAGIRAVMITGDYKDTAAAIAKDLGIIQSGDQVLTGAELNTMSDAELIAAAGHVNVFARVSPEHKVRIVDAIKQGGGIAAMTGDGVNDAPALKRADIGVAMGITGTDVAKETADMVLTDDNFTSIVSAVEEGRVIFSNIRKFVFFLLSCNVAEIAIIFISMLLGWPIPLLPIQLLWLNLVTDAFPALALGMEKKEPDIMNLPPRDPKEPILNREMQWMIVVQSAVLTFAVLGCFYFALNVYGDLDMARTYAFVTLMVAELLRAYTVRSERYNLWQIGVFSNRTMNIATLVSFSMLLFVVVVPFMQPIFNTVPLHMKDWDIMIGFAILPLIFAEIAKFFIRKPAANQTESSYAITKE